MFEKRLVVEVDGGQHGEEAIARRNEERTRCLNGKGYRVVRFRNSDIPGDLEGVLESIVEDSPAESGEPKPCVGTRHSLTLTLPWREPSMGLTNLQISSTKSQTILNDRNPKAQPLTTLEL